VTDIDPALLRADLPGKLSFNIATRGLGFDATVTFRSKCATSAATCGCAASGGGKMNAYWHRLAVRQIAPQPGATNLAVMAAWTTHSTCASCHRPGLEPAGTRKPRSVEGNGTVRGTLREPTIAANIHGRD